MRIRLLLATVVAPLAATVVGAQAAQLRAGNAPAAAGEGVMRGAAATSATPLRVFLLPPSLETNAPIRFVLNQPAYVAVFDVYPGSGVRLLYPEGTREEVQYAGLHQPSLITARVDADVLRAIFGPDQGGPHYLYIVASREPLGIGEYVHRPLRLVRSVGMRDYFSLDAYNVMDGLLSRVVSVGAPRDWDADVYLLWGARRPWEENSMTIACQDGRTIVVPIGYPFAGCPGDAQVVPSAQATAQQAVARAPAMPRPYAPKEPAMDQASTPATHAAVAMQNGGRGPVQAMAVPAADPAGMRAPHPVAGAAAGAPVLREHVPAPEPAPRSEPRMTAVPAAPPPPPATPAPAPPPPRVAPAPPPPPPPSTPPPARPTPTRNDPARPGVIQ